MWKLTVKTKQKLKIWHSLYLFDNIQDCWLSKWKHYFKFLEDQIVSIKYEMHIIEKSN